VPVVMAAYQELFEELADRRRAALNDGAAVSVRGAPLQFDPVRCFAHFASGFTPKKPPTAQRGWAVPPVVVDGRQTFNHLLRSVLGREQSEEIHHCFARKHGGSWRP
jgi:hypothetical protein